MTFAKFGLAFVLAAGASLAAAEAQQGNSINVVVSGLRNNNGDVRCGLFNSAATFPTDGKEFQKYQPVWTAASSRPAQDAEQLLKDFLPRAFRRPVPPEETDVYVQIARERIAAGDYFETAMRTAYRTALCSPDFLFLQEPPANPKDPTSLDQYAVASRL